jgi:hypothetical protein
MGIARVYVSDPLNGKTSFVLRIELIGFLPRKEEGFALLNLCKILLLLLSSLILSHIFLQVQTQFPKKHSFQLLYLIRPEFKKGSEISQI